MSGSDSTFTSYEGSSKVKTGKGNGDIGGRPEDTNPCLEIHFQTQLSSPKPDVISKLKKGDTLNIELRTIHTQVVVAAIFDEEIAGGIASPQISSIRECIQRGTKYRAKVISIHEGLVRIDVFALMNDE